MSSTHNRVRIHLAEQAIDNRGRVLVGPIDLDMARGETVVLLGPSGAGKTTLLECIAGIHTTLEASVCLFGDELRRPCRRVQLAFQDDRLPPWVKVRDVLTMVTPRSQLTEFRVPIDDLLDTFDLWSLRGAWVSHLSGGERSRLALARVLLDPPELLLLDEPFRNIDHLLHVRLCEWLARFIGERKITTLMVSHSVPDAVFFAGQVLLLEQRPMRVASQLTVPASTVKDRDAESFRAVVRDLRHLVEALAPVPRVT